MWLASEMAAFARVAELRSFTAAARALDVPKVAVSRAIVSLERRLGTRLLTRTTRRVDLTAAGSLLLPHCRRLLDEVEAVRSGYAATGTRARRLRVMVDAGYGRLLVSPLVPRFLEHHPEVELQVGMLEALPDRASPDWDVLVCNGAMPAAGLTHTPLGNPPLLLCATPAYLARHGRPRTPADLASHVVLRAEPAPLGAAQADASAALKLHRGDDHQQLRLRPALQVSDPALVHASTAASLGIGLLPEFLCRQGLAMARLERVLAEWSLDEPLQLQAVYATERAGSALLHQFIEFLLANMVPVLGAARAV
jgi:DNA-binding transcriptional LysR family regulator